jgi:PAS domain S-box-containing protein
MPGTLRILHLEDDPMDAELVAATLAADGLSCVWVRAATRAQFVEALEGSFDLILSDYALPGFDGVLAQTLARRRHPTVPFVFVSGTIGEEVAIDRMREGATDYVLKQRLTRLAPAVRRALKESRTVHERVRAEQAIDFLEHLLAASPSMIFRFDPIDWRVTFASPNIGWLLGYAREEVIDVPGFWEGIIHPDDRGAVIASLREAMAAAVVQIEQEYRCRGKDGRYRWFFNLLRIEYGPDAEPVSVLGYALDIADRKAAEAELREANVFLDSIVENLPDMIFVKDAANLRFVRFNRAGEALLGMQRAELIGLTDHDILPHAAADAVVAVDRATLAGHDAVDIPEEVVATRGRGARILHTKKIPIFDASGQPKYLLGISEDITERRAAAEEVRLARLEAERANRAKSEFLSRMSHDLRTPLNAVLGFAQILEMDGLPGDQADNVRQILKGGRHLLELINEVLDIARIEAGQLSLSPESVGLEELVQQCADLIQPLAAARGISVTVSFDPECASCVQADRQRLRQVFLNLLGNAVKYNREGGRVTIICARVAGGRVRASVTDTGAGILPDMLTMVFLPFERLGAESTGVEGTGLGLAVSKGLTEAMGGTIGVESEVDVGTTFWVEFAEGVPAEGAVPDAPVERPGTGGNARGTILYIEDNASNVRLLERLLQRRRAVQLVTAANGEDGIDLARRDRPDLILLDLHLPDLSGEEVLRRLWSDPLTRTLPIAVLSADATPVQRQRLLASGAIDYLTKPLDIAKVLALIDQRLDSAVIAGKS